MRVDIRGNGLAFVVLLVTLIHLFASLVVQLQIQHKIYLIYNHTVV